MMTKSRWIGLILGVSVFLGAFGAALAVTVFQVSRDVPSTLKFGSAVVISGDNLALWHDQAKTRPVTSLEFLRIQLQPPLEPFGTGIPRTTIFIENKSDLPLKLISPCGDVANPSGARIGFLDAGLVEIPTGRGLGSTCGQVVTLAPLDMVEADVHFHEIDPGLPTGDHTFTTVFGAVHVSGVDPIDPPSGMVSWWPGDGNASDIMDGNHGILTGDFAQGMVGQGFNLDGTGDFVLVPDNPNLNITGDVTVDLWAKRTVFGQSGFLVSKGAGAFEGVDAPSAFSLFFSSGDQLRGLFERDDGSNVFLFGPAVTDSDFHHFAYLRVGQEHALFMDGVVVASAIFTGDAGDTSGLPAVIGALRSDAIPSGFLAHFGGIIDEVEIFNRALSEAEIRSMFDAGSAGKIKPPGIAPPARMVSWWPGDGNANDIVDGNDGTLNGANFTAGKVGQAFSFDGVNDFVDTQATVGLTGAQARSIDVWVNIVADGGGSGAIPVGYGVAATDQLFALAITKPGGDLSAARNVFFSGFFNDLLGTMPISLNTWHHIAVTYDGTTVAIYVDGVLDVSALKSLGTINSVLSMGKVISGGWTPFNGLIDEVELFDRALSAAEIRAIFEAGSAGKRKP